MVASLSPQFARGETCCRRVMGSLCCADTLEAGLGSLVKVTAAGPAENFTIVDGRRIALLLIEVKLTNIEIALNVPRANFGNLESGVSRLF